MTALSGWAAESMAGAARLAAEVAIALLRLAWGVAPRLKARRLAAGARPSRATVWTRRAEQRLSALQVELVRLREAAAAFADIEREARAVAEAWVGSDRQRARQLERWARESSSLAFSEERWLVLTLRWRERQAREGGNKLAPDLEAWLAAQLLG